MNKNLAMIIIAIGTWLTAIGFSIGLGAFSASGNPVIIIPLMIIVVGILIIYFGVNAHYKALNKKFSKAYYLLPIILSLIGTVIVYLIFRKKDKKIADGLGWIGVVNVLVFLVISIIIAAILATWATTFL